MKNTPDPKLSVYSIIVTYESKIELIVKLIKRVLESGVDKVILVNNNDKPINLQNFVHIGNESLISIINVGKNSGTAKAFEVGLNFALAINQCDYIWLLDDDNLPQENCLTVLMQTWDHLSKNHTDFVLAGNRLNRHTYKDVINYNYSILGLKRKNSFWGFHINDFFQRKILNRKILIDDLKKYYNVKTSAYGGMFFQKSMINKLGFPDDRFFIFHDDFEYTYRFTSNGGKIFLVKDAEIIDIDNQDKIKSVNRYKHMIVNADSTRFYYGIRNSIIVEIKYNVDSKIIYYTNFFLVWISLACIGVLFLKFNRIKLLNRAIMDGLQQNLNN